MPSKNIIHVSARGTQKSTKVVQGLWALLYSCTARPKRLNNRTHVRGKPTICLCIGIGISSISIIGTVRVSSVKFCSTCLRALSASPAGGFPATATPLAAGSCGLWPWTTPVPHKVGRPHRSHICMQHKGHPSETLSSKKHDIYLKDIKITYTNKKKKKKNSTGGDLPISPRASPGGTGISGSLEKSIPAYG
jgi:hypothetical protein